MVVKQVLGIHQATGGFMKKVLSVYTHSMTTIYLSLSAQVAISTFFMKSPLADWESKRLVCPDNFKQNLSISSGFHLKYIICINNLLFRTLLHIAIDQNDAKAGKENSLKTEIIIKIYKYIFINIHITQKMYNIKSR